MPQPAVLHQDEGLPYAEQMCRAKVSPGRKGLRGLDLVVISQLLQSISVDIPAVNIKAAASPKPRPAA